MAGATVYIKGASRGSVAETAIVTSQELVRSMNEIGSVAYLNHSLIPSEDLEREVQSVSSFAGSRSEYLYKVLENIRAISFVNRNNFWDYVRDELAAAEVLLLSIEDYLKKGHVDTQALGEL